MHHSSTSDLAVYKQTRRGSLELSPRLRKGLLISDYSGPGFPSSSVVFHTVDLLLWTFSASSTSTICCDELGQRCAASASQPHIASRVGSFGCSSFGLSSFGFSSFSCSFGFSSLRF